MKYDGVELVLDNDGCPVVTKTVIKGKAVHHPAHRQKYLRACRAPYIDPQVYRPVAG